MTPDSEFATLSKGMWLMVAGVFWIFGAAAWLLIGRPRRLPIAYRSGRYGATGFSPSEALMRHPATQSAGAYAETGTWLPEHRTAMPVGPDDDDEFLQELARRIRESREDS